jgi:hypothetical protein
MGKIGNNDLNLQFKKIKQDACKPSNKIFCRTKK